MMTHSTHHLQYQISEVAAQLFVERGFEQVSMTEIAAAAAISEDVLYAQYGSKFDIVLQLYHRINADWQLAIGEMGETKLHRRFAEAMQMKLALMAPYAEALSGMMGHLLRSEKVGVGAARTGHIRAMGMSAIRMVVEGAEDAERLRRKVEHLPAALYLIHWTLLLLHVQSGNMEDSKASIEMASKMIQKARNASFLLPFFPFIQDLGAWAQRLVGQIAPTQKAEASAVLRQIFQHRKLLHADADCLHGTCERCLAIHLPKVEEFVARQQPIHLILPAFPAKSPNSRKTLGKLPDLGEEIALKSLQSLCDEIQAIYPPGARVTICSDGRIFSELVEVSDPEITEYVSALRKIVHEEGLKSIEVLNLEDFLPEMEIEAARAHVLAVYAEPLPQFTAKLKTSESFLKLFNGIHRFIAEDRQVLHPELSATKAKESAKAIALQVIQHSNAWTRFLAQLFPSAIRLSIHPYAAHSDKIGIRLTKATDDWLTPWHGAIVLGDDGYMLMKRAEAEALGAELVIRNQQPSHYTASKK